MKIDSTDLELMRRILVRLALEPNQEALVSQLYDKINYDKRDKKDRISNSLVFLDDFDLIQNASKDFQTIRITKLGNFCVQQVAEIGDIPYDFVHTYQLLRNNKKPSDDITRILQKKRYIYHDVHGNPKPDEHGLFWFKKLFDWSKR